MSVIKELKNENDKLKKDLRETNQRLDSMEQHGRRNNLRIWSKKAEEPGEDTDNIVIEHAKVLGIELKKQIYVDHTGSGGKILHIPSS